MDTTQITLLSFVQGFTEFLPISSSAHLILAPLLFGYSLQDLSFDVAVHLGTLGAVMTYFRRELIAIVRATIAALSLGRYDDPSLRLGLLIVVATLPLLILGFPLKALLETLREDERTIALVIAATTIGFGILLWVADRRGRRTRDEYQLSVKDALWIGVLQAIAIIPGTSRSGITITAGLFSGLTRRAASRFSFLLSIPTIMLAGLVATLDLVEAEAGVDWAALALGAGLSFVVAYLTIHFFLKTIESISMLPFVVYRLILGGVILFLIGL